MANSKHPKLGGAGAIDGRFGITIDGDTEGAEVGKALGGFKITFDVDTDGVKVGKALGGFDITIYGDIDGKSEHSISS